MGSTLDLMFHHYYLEIPISKWLLLAILGIHLLKLLARGAGGFIIKDMPSSLLKM